MYFGSTSLFSSFCLAHTITPLFALYAHTASRSLSGVTGDTKPDPREEKHPAGYIQIHSRFRVDRTPIVPTRILLISWKRSSQHPGTGRVGFGSAGVTAGEWARVEGFCAACKGKAVLRGCRPRPPSHARWFQIGIATERA